MCRHLAWLGEPRTVSSLVLEREHGLLQQSYAPRRQSHGTMNADGWGVGLLVPGRAEPVRWRSARPLWSDASFASVAGREAAAAKRSFARSPAAPVAQFALPLLMATARTGVRLSNRARLRVTQAAFSVFVVVVSAQRSGASETMRAQSVLLDVLSPAVPDALKNPCGSVKSLTAIPPA